MMDAGIDYRIIRLNHHNYMDIISYLGEKGVTTPDEASDNMERDWERVHSMLGNLEKRDLVEAVDEDKRPQNTRYELSEQGVEILEAANTETGSSEKEIYSPEIIETEPKRTNKEGTFLHGGYFVQGQSIEGAVKVRKTDRTYLPDVPEVEVVERLE